MPPVKFLVVGGLIIGSIAFLMFNGINDSMVYYYGVSEVLAKGPDIYDKGIRVSGYVSPGSIKKDARNSSVEFVVFEKKSDHTIPVTYQGVIPDTFKDHAEVVVEGTYNSSDQVFHATTLLAKCPSKYERLQEESDGEGHPAETYSPGASSQGSASDSQ